MNREELDKILDAWLDRASAEYGSAEIRPGFEARVIADLNSRLKQGNRRIPWIAFSVAAAAILIFGIGVLLTKFQEQGRPQIASKQPATSQPAVRQSAPPAAAPEVIGKPAAVRRVMGQPKEIDRGRFLSSLLTDQERYLVAYARIISTSGSGEAVKNEFSPTEIPAPQVPSPYVPELKSLSVDNKDLQIPKLQNEEQI